jgi:hypothetical protein
MRTSRLGPAMAGNMTIGARLLVATPSTSLGSQGLLSSPGND